MSDRIEGLVVLPRRAIRQPSPAIVSSGDCGPCALGGVLGLSVEAVYDLNRDGRRAMSWWCMRNALCDARQRGLADRTIDAVPFWPGHDPVRTWGDPSGNQNLNWFSYVRMALDAGYYGLACVVHAANGPEVATDHWVVLVGARTRHTPIVDGAGSITPEVLVSDSSTAHEPERWVSALDFLKRWGGFNVLLARPTP